MILVYLTLWSIYLLTCILGVLLLRACPVWYFYRAVSERGQDWFGVLLLINGLSLGWRSSAIVIIRWSASTLYRWQRVAISNHHAVVVSKHLLVGLSCMLLLQTYLWRLRYSNSSLTLWTLDFRSMLTIFGIASWTHRLPMMMSRCRYTLMWYATMGVAATSWGHGWVNAMPRAWNLLWSWAWSCRRWHLV